ncbi:unnamed protein product [Heterobilharzia americana]|nr:unnamed protein product [Heterobilharzia americana]
MVFPDAGSLMRTYSRGFPRGILGTVLFPDIYKAAESSTPAYPFWSKYDQFVYHENQSLKKTFQKFRDQLIQDYCITNKNKIWECCEKFNHPSCSKIPPNAKVYQTMLMDPINDIPLIFAYLWCTKAWASLKQLNIKQQENILDGIKMVVPIHALEIHAEQLKNDYECECDNDMLWDRNMKICQPINPCYRTTYPACIHDNTLKCIAYTHSEYECVCKSEYMGIDCSLPRDACHERVNKSERNGDSYCQIQLGNICQPILGTDYYTCQCLASYQPLLHISEPNCLGRIDPCLTIHADDILTRSSLSNGIDVNQIYPNENKPIQPNTVIHWGLTCLNGGQCITSADFTRAACVCPTAIDGTLLYTGLNCEYPVGIWSTWTLSSSCFPEDCGITRYRWRRRYCLNTTSSEYMLSNIDQSLSQSNEWIIINKRIPLPCSGTSEETCTTEAFINS